MDHISSLFMLTSQTLCYRLSVIVTLRITSVDEVATVDRPAFRRWSHGAVVAAVLVRGVRIYKIRDESLLTVPQMVCIRTVPWRKILHRSPTWQWQNSFLLICFSVSLYRVSPVLWFYCFFVLLMCVVTNQNIDIMTSRRNLKAVHRLMFLM